MLSERILIVDDISLNLDILNVYLKKAGYIVESAMTSDDAIAKINSMKIDLILLDAMMPNINGFELCTIIKSNIDSMDIPVIFITANSQTEYLVKAFEIGAVDYISKPFSEAELISRVQNHLRIVKQTKTIVEQNKALSYLNQEKNGIIELTAHDLKNPLQSIIGFSDLLISKLPESEHQLFSYAHSIKYSAQKAVNIIKDLNEVNLIEEGKLSLSIIEFDLRDILMKVIEDYIYIAESKNQVLIYNECDDELIVKSDTSKLSRIFDNLLSNALKFSNPNTKIIVSCELISNEIGNNYILVSFQDKGPGFTEEDMSKVFKKFAKLSARPTSDEPSTGLGLSIVKKLTELLDGEIVLESEYGQGSKFTLKFNAVV